MTLWDRKIALSSYDQERVKMKEEYAAKLNRWIRPLLVGGIVEVLFIKKNGLERAMSCTLQRSLLPKEELLEHHRSMIYNPCLVSVWDLDKQAWRSIPIDRLVKVEVDPLGYGDSIWPVMKTIL